MKLSKMVKGTYFYRQLINQHRQKYTHQQEDESSYPVLDTVALSSELHEVIHSIMEAVWEKDGRFLILDEKTGYISVAKTQQVYNKIRQDLFMRPIVVKQPNTNRKHNQMISKARKIAKKKKAHGKKLAGKKDKRKVEKENRRMHGISKIGTKHLRRSKSYSAKT